MANPSSYRNFIKKYTEKLPGKPHWEKRHFQLFGQSFMWFVTGGILGLFFFISFLYIGYKNMHTNKIYEGVLVNNINFSGKDPSDIQHYFADKNKRLQQTTITFRSDQVIATVSAKQIGFGYDANLLANQAMTIGRSSNNTISNISLLLQAYIYTINLPPAYHYSEQKLDAIIAAINQQVNVKPINPLFNVIDGKAVTFRVGSDGKLLDAGALKQTIIERMKDASLSNNSEKIALAMPVKTLHAADAADEANRLGIKEAVAEGTSQFHHSADERIFNISLAASKLNGVIIKPGEIFSFDKTIGDISALSGYKQAYVIQNGKTVLGDGGGVCQVSTTLFRAALNAGLPIVERHQHAYRVGYYEEDSAPGIDAAIYYPTVDLKFKNDTGHALLIQTNIDFTQQQLTFTLYGTKDPNRDVSISTPVVLSTSPAPPPLYQDDPTLPSGQVKQTDFAADGANVYFTRTVSENGKTSIYDKFTSNYKPWQAIYMKGTKT